MYDIYEVGTTGKLSPNPYLIDYVTSYKLADNTDDSLKYYQQGKVNSSLS